jgi:hypothetical protein
VSHEKILKSRLNSGPKTGLSGGIFEPRKRSASRISFRSQEKFEKGIMENVERLINRTKVPVAAQSALTINHSVQRGLYRRPLDLHRSLICFLSLRILPSLPSRFATPRPSRRFATYFLTSTCLSFITCLLDLLLDLQAPPAQHSSF